MCFSDQFTCWHQEFDPGCSSLLTLPVVFLLQLGELSEAEDALSEANILNNSDPEVWGYLSLVCLKTGRQLEAEQAYKYAIKVRGRFPSSC